MLNQAIQNLERDDRRYSPVTSYLLAPNSDELDIERLQRKDLSFNLDPNLDFDILSEDLLYSDDVSNITIEKILETAEENIGKIENSIAIYINWIKTSLSKEQQNFNEHPKGVYHANYKRLNIASEISKESAFKKQLDNVLDTEEKYRMVLKHCEDNIYNLRSLHWSMVSNSAENDAQLESQRNRILSEIKNQVLNIRNFRYAASNKNFNDLRTRLMSIDFYNQPYVTILRNNKQAAYITYEEKEISLLNQRFLWEMMKIVEDPNTNLAYNLQSQKLIDRWKGDGSPEDLKKQKKAIASIKNSTIPSIYSGWNGTRPSQEFNDFETWNGLQIFDLDVKNDPEAAERITEIKQQLHQTLSQYTWYVGIKSSSSGKGVHIITKVKPPHLLYVDLRRNMNVCKFWFMMNYHHKFTIVKWVLLNQCGLKPNLIHKVIDKAMMNISQGILLNHDPNPLWSENFIELPLWYGLHIPPVENLPFEEWILHPDNLKYILTAKKAAGHENLSAIRRKTEHTYDSNPNFDTINFKFSSTGMPDDLSVITPLDSDAWESGHRDYMRQKVVRTVIYIYGNNNQSMDLCRRLLSVPDKFSENEFWGKWKYASRNPFCFEGILNLLSNAGCQFDVDQDTIEDLRNSKLQKAAEALRDTDVDFSQVVPDWSIELTEKKPYLGQWKNEILGALKSDKVNVIEAAPGRGKTTLFNDLAKEKTVLLVCPYTSVLKNKIELDEDASKLFDVCYGNRKIEIKKGRSVATTFDKFSRLTNEDYKNFDLIAIDESHLLFTSPYRDNVTTKAANNTRKFVSDELALREQIKFSIGITNKRKTLTQNSALYNQLKNTGTKVVMMTGTVTGELLYFGKLNVLNYIKINSKHPHGKYATIRLTDSEKNKKHAIAIAIRDALDEGKTVIVPTNAGDKYVQSIVDQMQKLQKGKKIKDDEWAYYRKSNTEHPICYSINHHSKLPDNARLLFCTVYLGVGVDILNNNKYMLIYDGDIFTAQDIEQFNNRIRRAPIHCTIVYSALSISKTTGEEQIKKSIYDAPSQIQLKTKEDYLKEINDDAKIAMTNWKMTRDDKYNLQKLPEYLSLHSQFHDIESGNIVFNDDKFIIRNFSFDYTKVAAGAAYTKWMLIHEYGYQIKYDFFYQNDLDERKELEEIAKVAKAKVAMRKADAFSSSVHFIADNWEKLKNKKIVEYSYIDEIDFKISKEDVSTKDGQKILLKFSRTYEDQIDMAYRYVRKLIRVYSKTTTKKIIDSFIGDTGKINTKELIRTCSLIQWVKQSEDEKMLVATSDSFTIIDDCLNEELGVEELSEDVYLINDMSFRNMRMKLLNYADVYFKEMSEDNIIESSRRREELFDKTKDFIKVFLPGRKVANSDDYKCRVRKIPKFDSPTLNQDQRWSNIIKRYLVNGVFNLEDNQKEIDVIMDDTENRKSDDFTKKVSSNRVYASNHDFDAIMKA